MGDGASRRPRRLRWSRELYKLRCWLLTVSQLRVQTNRQAGQIGGLLLVYWHPHDEYNRPVVGISDHFFYS